MNKPKFKYEQYDYSDIDGCHNKYSEWFSSATVYEPIRDGSFEWEMRLTPPAEVSFRPSYASTNESKRWSTSKSRQVGKSAMIKFYDDCLSLRQKARQTEYFKRINYFKKMVRV